MRPLADGQTDIAQITRRHCALPTLGPRLARIRADVLRCAPLDVTPAGGDETSIARNP